MIVREKYKTSPKCRVTQESNKIKGDCKDQIESIRMLNVRNREDHLGSTTWSYYPTCLKMFTCFFKFFSFPYNLKINVHGLLNITDFLFYPRWNNRDCDLLSRLWNKEENIHLWEQGTDEGSLTIVTISSSLENFQAGGKKQKQKTPK